MNTLISFGSILKVAIFAFLLGGVAGVFASHYARKWYGAFQTNRQV